MGNGTSKVTTQDRAILDMKIQRDKLRQYQKRIRAVLDREQEIAKECLAKGDKKRALLALRKRKYQEKLLSQTDQQLETLEQLTNSIEFALVQKDVMFGLQQGSQVLKILNQEMSLERVEKILDESAEGIAYQDEVTEMLASKISNADEADVQDELDAMEREELAKKIPAMPNVPTQVVDRPESENVAEEEEEEEDVEEEPVRRQPVLA